jgi:uncharacterized RDD family membrane protein YckC
MERVTRPEGSAEIAGFFQRLFALIIDTILLTLVFFFGVVGMLGWFAPEALLAQTLISFVYFAVLNSSVGGGATIGKRIMGVRVVNRSGYAISFGLGLWRAAFNSLPTLCASYLPVLVRNPDLPIAAIGTAVGLGFWLTDIYLYCFNWQTRQVLHDFVAGTFVVKAESADRPFMETTWWGHVAFAVLIIAASAYVGTKVTVFQQAVQGRPVCVEPITTAVEKLPFVRSAWVDRNPWSPAASSDPEQRTVIAFVRSGEPGPQARVIARATLAACPAIRDEHRLTITLIPPHEHYTMVPQMSSFPGVVKEWRDSLDFESRAARNEGRCDIASAVRTLPFAGQTKVDDFYVPRDGKTLHVKRIEMALTDPQIKTFIAGRAVVRKALAACPSMDDATVLTVLVTSPGDERGSPVAGTVQEWRSSIAFEAAHPPRPSEPNRTVRYRRLPSDIKMPVPNGQ